MGVVFKGRGIKSMQPKQTSENRKRGMQYESKIKVLSVEKHERKFGYGKQHSCKHSPGTDRTTAGQSRVKKVIHILKIYT